MMCTGLHSNAACIITQSKRFHVQNAISKYMYSKTCVNVHSKLDKSKILMTNGSLFKIKILQNAPLGSLSNTFDLH